MDGITRNPNYHHNNYQVRKWLLSLPTFAWRDKNKWYLIVPDWEYPVNTYVVVHDDRIMFNKLGRIGRFPYWLDLEL